MAGFDISASNSDATSQAIQGGAFNVVGGGNSLKYVTLALIGLGALAIVAFLIVKNRR